MFAGTPTSAVDATTSFTSSAIELVDAATYQLVASFSGADVAGTFKLQSSVDGSNWFDVSGKSAAITASGAAQLDDVDAPYRYFRYDWAYSSGTGNITVSYAVKGYRNNRATDLS